MSGQPQDMLLTQAEIDDLCHPLTQHAAQIRHLRAAGLTVTTKPNGQARVVRSHAEAVLSGQRMLASPAGEQPAAAPPAPNVDGFLRLVGGKSHGAKKKVQPA